MGLENRQEITIPAEESSSEKSVEVIDDAVLQGARVNSLKQKLRDMDEIMEGDIILKVNPGGDWQIISGNNKSKYCMEHLDLHVHQDDNLPKVGDVFKTHQDFVHYISSNAKRWCFYYKCTESQNKNTENEAYTYHCVYLKNREYKKKTLKKRHNFKTDCPCKIKLKRKPNEGLKVVFVCNHHDHDLSEESFHKLQTNKKLSPYLKEVIMDLLSLEVAIGKIRKYVEMESGVKMSRAFFYDVERKMKLNNEERQITDKRLKELSEKMSVLDEFFHCDDDDNSEENSKKRSKIMKSDLPSKRLKIEQDIDDEINNSEEYLEDNLEDSQDGMTTLGWDESAIATEESPENTEEILPETENAYTDDYNSADYTVSETVADVDAADDTQQPADETQQPDQPGEQIEYQTVVLQDEFGNVLNCENGEQIVFLQDNENVPEGQTIGYFDGEKIIYVDPNEANNENEKAHDVGVQTNSQRPGHSYVPMFDVYMKNGNVTGFVVSDNVAESVGGAAVSQKAAQTRNDAVQESKVVDEGSEIPDLPAPNGTQEIVNGDTYTKHEYIHRYNIDHYMTLANFPKYIDTLAKKTRNDVLSMLTRVYNEKAMFKMTTTQKGNEGNTKIWYLTDVRRKGKYKMSEEEKMKRDKIGQYITDILILKEKVKTLTNDNSELVTRNKYLEDVALRLAKMRN